MTPEEIDSFIASSNWVFAKTMAENPHEYTLRKAAPDGSAFERFVLHIRSNGYDMKFKGRTYQCLDVGPHRYWTMGAPLEFTTLVNRALNQT